jgi:hypothetical protein
MALHNQKASGSIFRVSAPAVDIAVSLRTVCSGTCSWIVQIIYGITLINDGKELACSTGSVTVFHSDKFLLISMASW